MHELDVLHHHAYRRYIVSICCLTVKRDPFWKFPRYEVTSLALGLVSYVCGLQSVMSSWNMYITCTVKSQLTWISGEWTKNLSYLKVESREGPDLFALKSILRRACTNVHVSTRTVAVNRHTVAFSNYTLVILYLDAANFCSKKYFYWGFLCGKSSFHVASDHWSSGHKTKCLPHVCCARGAWVGFPDELNDFFSSPEGAPLCTLIKLCNEERNKNEMLLTSVFYSLAFVLYFRTFVPFLSEPRSRRIDPKS